MLTALQVLGTCFMFFFFGFVLALVFVGLIINKMVIDGRIKVDDESN